MTTGRFRGQFVRQIPNIHLKGGVSGWGSGFSATATGAIECPGRQHTEAAAKEANIRVGELCTWEKAKLHPPTAEK
jgi:hypothetical protein